MASTQILQVGETREASFLMRAPFGNPGIPVWDGIQLFCWFFDLSHPPQDQWFLTAR